MSTLTVAHDAREERRTKYHEADVVVVGAGVFGCAIAYTLANQDRSVLLLERWMKEPNRIVGELMQPGGVEALQKLGLGHTIEGIDAMPCYGYDVLYHGRDVPIPYPKLGGHFGGPENGSAVNGHASGSAKAQEKERRPEGRSFHHGRFIANLRKACLKHPNITVVETEAITAVKGEYNAEILGVEARTVNPDTGKKEPDFFFGQLTIVADGYASVFRKKYIKGTPIVKSKFYALELIDCPLPHPGFGHVVIGAAPSPVLLYQIGTHETRALIDVPEKCAAASPAVGGVRGYITNVVIPTLPPAIRPCFQAALDKDTKIPPSMPNSWLPPAKQGSHPGLVILGDAYNMRHPLTGGGMTVALNDVVILSDLLSPSRISNLGDTRLVAKAMHAFHWQRKSLTSIINVLAQALYSLFSAADPNLAKLQRGCFAYFELGITDDPMGLMGGLIHRPAVLAYHFFAVAFLAIWIDAKNTGLWNLPLLLWRAVSVLWTACVVFLPVMYREIF
ncbi:squalene epoxidase [Xylariales sp. AK1849]|nr:squalene epoxidase [Xylariales sp. AK1849]